MKKKFSKQAQGTKNKISLKSEKQLHLKIPLKTLRSSEEHYRDEGHFFSFPKRS